MIDFSEFGLEVPEILLPKEKKIDSWSVIACDQYTQDLDYWHNVEKSAASFPSTLNLILPEVYLSSPDRKERIEKIRNTMKSYLKDGIFDSEQKEFIYIERKTSYGRIRKGLLAAIDLDSYEWKPFSKALIRATEATIVDRIPPRMEIRRGAALESPHIMLLVNDSEKVLIEKAGQLVKNNIPLYDGDLMLNSGHITGWAVGDEKSLSQIYSSLKLLKEKNTAADGSSFMFAVGDGNHSLATAKAVWDEYKNELKSKGVSEKQISECPVRYALVEIVNIYDEGLTFEPIHRVLFNADIFKCAEFVQKNLGGNISVLDDEKSLEEKVKSSKSSFGFVSTVEGNVKYLLLETPVTQLAVSCLQPVLDKFISENKNIEIDYIHGSDEVFRLAKKENALTIMLPPVAKDSFFSTINLNGPLPRKSFSMGESSEKRFYLECRKLFEV